MVAGAHRRRLSWFVTLQAGLQAASAMEARQ